MDTNSYEYRGMIIALSVLLQRHYSFSQIADLFYKGGIIQKPEKPWPDYVGSKADYSKEKLSAATGNENFFTNVLPEVFGSLDSGFSKNTTGELAGWCVKLGYKIIEQEFEDPERDIYAQWRDLIPPQNNKQSIDRQIGIIAPDPQYPNQVLSLLGQFNDNLCRNNLDASALLIRRLIFVSSIIYMKQNNKEHLLTDASNDYKELGTLLEIVSQNVPDVSKQLVSRIRIAKWMGDNANHALLWKATAQEVAQSAAVMGQFLRFLFAQS